MFYEWYSSCFCSHSSVIGSNNSSTSSTVQDTRLLFWIQDTRWENCFTHSGVSFCPRPAGGFLLQFILQQSRLCELLMTLNKSLFWLCVIQSNLILPRESAILHVDVGVMNPPYETWMHLFIWIMAFYTGVKYCTMDLKPGFCWSRVQSLSLSLTPSKGHFNGHRFIYFVPMKQSNY